MEGITVEQLLQFLQTQPADAIVCYQDHEHGEWPVREVTGKQSAALELVRETDTTTVRRSIPIVLLS